MSPDLRERKDADWVSLDLLESMIISKADAIDGVTISGGEPFDQVDELGSLVSFLSSNVSDDIVVYTGYSYEEVANMAGSRKVLENISTLIDGSYQHDLDSGVGLRGSVNQRVIRLTETNRYNYENASRKRQGFLFGDALFIAGLRSCNE